VVATASVVVENTGEVPGAEVVQIYVEDPVMDYVSRPSKGCSRSTTATATATASAFIYKLLYYCTTAAAAVLLRYCCCCCAAAVCCCVLLCATVCCCVLLLCAAVCCCCALLCAAVCCCVPAGRPFVHAHGRCGHGSGCWRSGACLSMQVQYGVAINRVWYFDTVYCRSSAGQPRRASASSLPVAAVGSG
jgi:hypothetical protein